MIFTWLGNMMTKNTTVICFIRCFFLIYLNYTTYKLPVCKTITYHIHNFFELSTQGSSGYQTVRLLWMQISSVSALIPSDFSLSKLNRTPWKCSCMHKSLVDRATIYMGLSPIRIPNLGRLMFLQILWLPCTPVAQFTLVESPLQIKLSYLITFMNRQ